MIVSHRQAGFVYVRSVGQTQAFRGGKTVFVVFELQYGYPGVRHIETRQKQVRRNIEKIRQPQHTEPLMTERRDTVAVGAYYFICPAAPFVP